MPANIQKIKMITWLFLEILLIYCWVQLLKPHQNWQSQRLLSLDDELSAKNQIDEMHT